jgi:hypothetical protein
MSNSISEEDLQKAVAEYLGWTDFCYVLVWKEIVLFGRLKSTNSQFLMMVPDYAKSLDAMHEAEQSLDGYMMLKYATELMFASNGPGTAGSFSHVHADAETRAKAFLLTVGKKIPPHKKKNPKNKNK